jgi:uncharacterized protein (TIGR02270 family)
VRPWLDSSRVLERYLGVAACSVHRADPHEQLARLIEDKDLTVRARALRLVGELGRMDLTEQLARAMDTDVDDTPQFWASWSLALLTGAPRAVAELQKMSRRSAPEAGTAFDLALRALSLDDAKSWLRTLNGDPDRARQVVIGLGVIGDPFVVPWLIDRMHDSALARIAGESLSMITGADFDYLDLEGEAPKEFEAGPFDETADERAGMDEDERLPWPDQAKVQAWWTRQAHGFTSGQRYFFGSPVCAEACEQAWTEGYQRQRRAAALELGRLRPTDVLRNWRACARTIEVFS